MGKEAIIDRITAQNVGFDLNQEADYMVKAVKGSSSGIQTREIIETSARQIRTYESETLEDSVVSFYPCYIHSVGTETKLSSSVTPDKKFFIESQIDPLERDGATLNGFRVLQDKIGDKKGDRVFLWVSPKGPAGTQGIFKDINYGYHQIYLGAIKDGKSETYALKSDVKEEVIATWINQVSKGETSVKGETSSDFLLNPVVVPFGSSDFSSENAISAVLYKLKEILKRNNQSRFYESVEIDNLPFVIKREKIKQEKDVERISRELESHFSSDKYLGFEEARKAIAGQLYVLYDRYANERGEVKLMGCAGGNISINNLFGNSLGSTINNIFSTEFRLQSAEWFSCPRCKFKADGPVGDQCPKCGLTKDEYREAGNEVC